jgi:tRNA A22 N-methylase
LRLPKRLFQIYTLAHSDGLNTELWDIGCDHSLLARINMREGRFSNVYCVDKSKSSLKKLLNDTNYMDLKTITLVESDGCDLDWKMVRGAVVIAGVGGNTVLKVVQSCPESYRNRITWVLNPFTSVDKFLKEIVQFLPGRNVETFEIKENGRIRFIFRILPIVPS